MATNQVGLDNAKFSLLVANDANFLLKRLKKDPAVNELARTESPDNLIAWLTARMDAAPKNLDEALAVYMRLAALSLQGQDAVRKLTESSLKLPKIEWGDRLIGLIIAGAKSVSRTIFGPEGFVNVTEVKETEQPRQRSTSRIVLPGDPS